MGLFDLFKKTKKQDEILESVDNIRTLNKKKKVVIQEEVTKDIDTYYISYVLEDFEAKLIIGGIKLEDGSRKELRLWEGSEYDSLTENPTIEQIEDRVKFKL